MPQTVAAGLLALVGIFDIAGTVLSGWLADRSSPRLLLAIYYAGRGLCAVAAVVSLTVRRRAPEVEPEVEPEAHPAPSR